ncbi:MAG: 2-amino-4-hydroxy-6-hydroxymethyldihydropteridine diphosphokinase [Woeseiaceae bacterium]|nr:2-amino-4-hydroxy-6-hydroxymethyldihydropteridine diphosphokinase [Woeseiaceae bacterium]
MKAGGRWRPAYVGIGSNLDSPLEQVQKAFENLAALPRTRLEGRSGLYHSAPMGPQDQPDFVNAAAALLTRLDASALLTGLQKIETQQGRVRGQRRWGPRTLDLDLLVYADLEIDAPGLVVPHPGIAERNFVLLPLMDVAPHLQVPGRGSVMALAASLSPDAPPLVPVGT